MRISLVLFGLVVAFAAVACVSAKIQLIESDVDYVEPAVKASRTASANAGPTFDGTTTLLTTGVPNNYTNLGSCVLSSDEKFVYFTNSYYGRVYSYELATGAIVRVDGIGEAAGPFTMPWALAINPNDTNTLFVTDNYYALAKSVFSFDLTTKVASPLNEAPFGLPQGIAVGASNYPSDALVLLLAMAPNPILPTVHPGIDTITLTAQGGISGPTFVPTSAGYFQYPVGIQSDPLDPGMVWVTDEEGGTLSHVNLTTGAMTHMVYVGAELKQPTGLVINNAGTTAYIVDSLLNHLYAIDLATSLVTQVDTAFPGRTPLGVTINAEETMAYISTFEDANLYAINITRTN